MASFDIDEIVYTSQSLVIERGRWKGKAAVRKRVLSSTDLETSKQLRHEAELLGKIDSPRVVKAYFYGAFPEGNGIVLEDIKGQTLEAFDGPLTLDEFFPVALSLCDAVAGTHDADIIHKFVNPSNVIVAPSGDVTLLGFTHATSCARELSEYTVHTELLGDLSYVAPEQTGRMNRPTDYRADLYSLGATLYFMLTGRPPFTAAEPLQLIHSHIALKPRELSECPPILNDIIQLLLEKNAEDRYQSAQGLRADLEQCQKIFEETATVDAFPLRTQDTSRRFTLPTKLYGRDKERERMERVFRSLGDGEAKVLLVGGYSGVGKTSLVHEVHRSLAAGGGYYTSGKFDQYKRDVPFSAIAHCFSELFRQILTESDAEVSAWKTRILGALGDEGRALIHHISRLEQLIGPQPEVPELPAKQARERLGRLFSALLGCLAGPDRPLVVFVDDLQWADEGTLDFIEQATTDAKYTLFIGAFRDNEVNEDHALTHLLQRISTRISDEIILQPLSAEVVTEMVADTLRSTPDRVADLGNLLFQKTHGNPFFVGQLLLALYHEGIISHQGGAWHWDLERARTLGATDNVVDLMCRKIESAEPAVQELLKHAACVGANFDLRRVASLLEATDLDQVVDHAVVGGFLVHLRGQSYKFLHDRVQQAAYTLVSEERRPELHRAIAESLLSDGDTTEENLFLVAAQFNRGSTALREEQLELAANLNLRASKRALNVSATQSALSYSQAGLEHAGRAKLEPLQRELHFVRAKTLIALGQLADADKALRKVLILSKSTALKAEAYEVRASVALMQGDPKRGLSFVKPVVEALGFFNVNTNPSRAEIRDMTFALRASLSAGRLDELEALDRAQDANFLAWSGAYPFMFSAAYMANPLALLSMSLDVVTNTFEFGYTSSTPLALAALSLSYSAMLGDHDGACEIAQVAMRLADNENAFIRGRVHVMCHYFASHLASGQDGLAAEDYQRAVSLCDRANDLEFLGWARLGYAEDSFWRRDLTEGTYDRLDMLVEAYSTNNIHFARDTFDAYHEFFRTLRGQGDSASEYLAPPRQSHRRLAERAPKNRILAARLKVLGVYIRLLFHGPDEALTYLDETSSRGQAMGTAMEVTLGLYTAIAHMHGDGEPEAIDAARDVIHTHYRSNPELLAAEFAHCEAEYAWTNSRATRAAKLFEKAAKAAEKGGANLNFAMVCFRAALFFDAQEQPKTPQEHSRGCYTTLLPLKSTAASPRWGSTKLRAPPRAQKPTGKARSWTSGR